MSEILERTLHSCNTHKQVFCKFVSANDVGTTGAHQYGIYIPKNSYKILFDEIGVKGENKDKYIKINWQDDFETDSRFIYYGQKTRNEYRITRFGRGFPYLKPENVGDLFILVKAEEDYYYAFFLSSDEDIDQFLAYYGMSPTDTNSIINKKKELTKAELYETLFHEYITNLMVQFPTTSDISKMARSIYFKVIGRKLISPDKLILNWLDVEFRLFKAVEDNRYKERIKTPFNSIDELVDCANTLLNRRKSRAGKSLENHLGEIFTISKIQYSSQVVTEGNKKPDFIFPSKEAYHNFKFDDKKLTFLAAKTTCKDRWRQILNEADRIPKKYLFTLQQGISENQLKEMNNYNVSLVVPKDYICSFPEKFRKDILSLQMFIEFLKHKQNIY